MKRAPALDRIDVKILAALQRDGRLTIQKLAETIGLSPRATLERVRRLEAAGIIAGYQAVVELRQLSRPVNIFAEIILEKHANRGRFEKRLAVDRRGRRVLGGERQRRLCRAFRLRRPGGLRRSSPAR